MTVASCYVAHGGTKYTEFEQSMKMCNHNYKSYIKNSIADIGQKANSVNIHVFLPEACLSPVCDHLGCVVASRTGRICA